jgi:AcrR family transcriptional regulator
MTRAPDSAPLAPRLSLSERHVDQTRQWLVAAAVELMEANPDAPLVNQAIAQRSGVSERTVYRYFVTRDSLLDAVALAVSQRLESPLVPSTLALLPAFAQDLFASFERQPQLTRAALRPEVFVRMRDGVAAQRRTAIQSLVDVGFAQVPTEERRLAAANIRYLLSATTWRYYRDNFGFTPEEAVRSVQTAVRHTVAGLALAQAGAPA